LHPDAVLFAGDDVTDEDALEVLQPGDVGIKVGSATTVAPWRVDGPHQLALALQTLAMARFAFR
jgi:trehalose 6-phosphate phosphatase